MILLALGFLGPEPNGLLAELGVRLDGRGLVAADAEKMRSVLVVWAIADGRRAARGVGKYLMGETALP